MNNTTNKRNTNIGGIEYATKFAANAKPYEIFMNKSVDPAVLSYKNGSGVVNPISSPTDLTSIQNDLTALDNRVDVLEAGGGSEYTETIVNITSAQILAMGATPIELLPAPGVGKYYDIEKIVLEFTAGNSVYTCADAFLYFDAPETSYINSYFIKAGNSSAIFRNSGQSINIDETAQLNGFQMSFNLPCNLTTLYNANPEAGDGTLRAIITYTIRTFGA